MRVFIAIEIPGNVKDKLVEVQERLRPQLPEVRWEKREKLHITLVFLGDVKEGRKSEVETRLIASVQKGVGRWAQGRQVRGKPFKLHLKGLGVFPNERRPRVVWVGTEEKFPHPRRVAGEATKLIKLKVGKLEGLVESLKKSLEDAGFGFDKKPFYSHITIGRAVRPKFPRGSGVSLWRAGPPDSEALGGLKGVCFEVDSVSIIKSELHPTGSIYTVFSRVPLES